MGRQWLQAKREVAGLKKGQAVGKLVKEIMVASKLGGPEPDGNPRLFAIVEKARRQSVSRDVIERAIKKGAGIGADKLIMEHVVFGGLRAAQGAGDRGSAHGQQQPHRAGDARAFQKGPTRHAGEQQVSL